VRLLTLCALALIVAALPIQPTIAAAIWTTQPISPPAQAPSGNLAAVACSRTSCLAVGSHEDSAGLQVPLAESFNGASWLLLAAPAAQGAAASALQGVACVSTTTCVAVGYWMDATNTRAALVERWDGLGWSIDQVPSPVGSGLTSISCTASDACTTVGSMKTAAGETALVERWNGFGWAQQNVPQVAGAASSTLASVSCGTATSCVAVGAYTDSTGQQFALAETWDGRTWSRSVQSGPATGSGSALVGVSCVSSTACTAVGAAAGTDFGFESAGALVERWDGSLWMVQSAAQSVGGQLLSVSCATAMACTAVGTNNIYPGTLAETWDGSGWTLQTTPNPSGENDASLTAVACVAAATCESVGHFEGNAPRWLTVAERQSGSAWSLQPTPNATGAASSTLSAVTCFSGSSCLAIGNYFAADGAQLPFAERWNGTVWTPVPMPFPDGARQIFLPGMSCASSTWCMAVGSSWVPWLGLNAFVEHWDGASWSIASAPVPTDNFGSMLTGISCSAANACMAVGSYQADWAPLALVERWDGSSWSLATTPNPSNPQGIVLSDVSCTAISACMAVGSKPAVSSDSPTLAARWDGATWTILSTPAMAGAAGGSELDKIVCSSSSSCMAVGQFWPAPAPHPGLSFAVRWDGATWALEPTMNPSGTDEAPLGALSCASPSDCTAVGFYVDRSGVFRTLAEHWNGGAWTIQSTSTSPGAIFNTLLGVSCLTAAGCTIVGNVSTTGNAVPLVLHSSG
jgi:hypothetical protein